VALWLCATSKALGCVPVSTRGARRPALPSAEQREVGQQLLANGQWSADSSGWSLPSRVPPVTGPARGGKKKLIYCILSTHQGTLTAPACRDLSRP